MGKTHGQDSWAKFMRETCDAKTAGNAPGRHLLSNSSARAVLPRQATALIAAQAAVSAAYLASAAAGSGAGLSASERRYMIMSARWAALDKPAKLILVPGTKLLGLARNWSRSS